MLCTCARMGYFKNHRIIFCIHHLISVYVKRSSGRQGLVLQSTQSADWGEEGNYGRDKIRYCHVIAA